MMDLEEAKTLLKAAGIFFHNGDTEDDELGAPYTINFNDTWGWACADCETVPEEELPRVAELYGRYGWCGVLYWASERSEPRARSEFYGHQPSHRICTPRGSLEAARAKLQQASLHEDQIQAARQPVTARAIVAVLFARGAPPSGVLALRTLNIAAREGGRS